jgi:hypothetical protein
LVLAAQVNDAARFGKPFHVLDRVGNYISSFGQGNGTVIPGLTLPLSRWVSAAARGGFWSVPVTGGYLIELWTVDGKRVAAFRRAADWFPTTGSPRLGFTRSDPPTPQILSIVEDQNGILWLAIRVADRNWKSAVRWDDRSVGEQALRPIIEDRSRAFDVIIEAIDVREGKLLLQERLDEAWAVFVDRQRLLSVHEQSDGGIEVRIRQFGMRATRQERQ